MAYNPKYSQQEYLFQELVIYGKNVNMVAKENKVTRSCIMSYIKKYDMTNMIEEFINDIGDYQRLKKIRKEYFEKLDNGLIEEKNFETSDSTYKCIEMTVDHPTQPGYKINRVFEVDYAISEEELAKLNSMLDEHHLERVEVTL